MSAASVSEPAKGRAVNVADRLASIAGQMPDAIAVACPGRGEVAGRNTYDICTYRELNADAESLARGLVDMGVAPQDRLALLVRPGIAFVKLVFALLRSGATTVLVDPGMGVKRVLACLDAMDVDGFVAVSPAHALRRLLGKRFIRARQNVTVGKRWFWGGPTFDQLLQSGQASRSELPITQASDAAAIIFTSGSTGPPKGVLYTHQMFDTQAAEIRGHYDLSAGGADLSCFPLFGLFNSAMGVTTVFPKMDFSRPASCKPDRLLAAASDWRVTQAFASPAVWDRLSRHCAKTGESIKTLRNIFSCGAPVPAAVVKRTLDCIAPGAQMHTPYGATEALPVASATADEILGETAELTDLGRGVCVGGRFDSIDWQIIRITDDPIATLEDAEEVSAGEIGELIVRGPQVSPAYIDHAEANDGAKIIDGDSTWHRMGDVGYIDGANRFWYCGRKSHRVEMADATLFSVPTEAIFNTHPQVRRTALVGLGKRPQQTPALIVEPGDGYSPAVLDELRQLANTHEQSRCIENFLTHARFPVDIRHNSKINREQLAVWASTL